MQGQSELVCTKCTPAVNLKMHQLQYPHLEFALLARQPLKIVSQSSSDVTLSVKIF